MRDDDPSERPARAHDARNGSARPEAPRPAPTGRPAPAGPRLAAVEKVPRDEPSRRRLLARYAADRRPELLEALVISYMPLAISLAHRYTTGREADADLEQAACEGLVKALRRFDPARGAEFTAFAVPTILGEIRRFIRDTSWRAHVPRAVQNRVLTVREASARLGRELGRSATARELQQDTGITEDELFEAMFASASAKSTPLADDRDDDGPPALQPLGTDDPEFARVEDAVAVSQALPALVGDERTVVELHFGDGLTHRQIAATLGCSRSHVGRLMASALHRLRDAAA